MSIALQSPSQRGRSFSDPLTRALLPPPDETPEECEQRIQAELEAKKVSDAIDEQIKLERAALKKKKQEIKVLLLGQSESGKSTTLKQFQLLHSPSAFHADRIAWRAVIYLNLVRSILRILTAITTSDPQRAHANMLNGNDSLLDLPNVSSMSTSRNDEDNPNDANHPHPFSPNTLRRFESFAQHLSPLTDLEERLLNDLSTPGDSDREATRLSSNSSLTDKTPGSKDDASKSKEPTVHTSSNWKKSLSFANKMGLGNKSGHGNEVKGWWEDPEDPVHVLNACVGGQFGMVALWKDPDVREALDRQRVRMEESSGFYLDEIERITAMKFIPTDDDVLKARLKTLGVVEHTFSVKGIERGGLEWRIFDVGGARNQRQVWAPFFDDANAIIFLAPISAFDQVLVEDTRVNRLEDSLLLWKSICSNKLLSDVNIILFLNKCDLLRAKLDAGVLLSDHMISYGDRPNNYDSISKYFYTKFNSLHQTFTPNKERELYTHLTSVTDKRKTSIIISNVRDIIIKANLRNTSLI